MGGPGLVLIGAGVDWGSVGGRVAGSGASHLQTDIGAYGQMGSMKLVVNETWGMYCAVITRVGRPSCSRVLSVPEL